MGLRIAVQYYWYRSGMQTLLLRVKFSLRLIRSIVSIVYR